MFSGTSEFDSSVETIQSYVKSLPGAASELCDRNTCCNITASESCAISSMKKDTTTLVLPGGETRCIASDSTPFAFQVIPGDSDKLLFYFQGGGACWDKISTNLEMCSFNAGPQGPVGVFDRENKDNKFATYTIVHVLYCSGDVHGGHTTRTYRDSNGIPYQQKGLANAQSALDWVLGQVESGALASSFTELVLMGCSAGSVGVQLWSKTLLDILSWDVAAVIPDSYAGLFPEGSMGPLIKDFGFCKSGFLSPELLVLCDNATITMQDITSANIAASPLVPYAFIQSKADYVQQSFYIAVALTGGYSAKMDPVLFYQGINDIFAEYNTANNFLLYLVNGPKHCYTNSDYFYEADAVGPKDAGVNYEGIIMADWATQFPLQSGARAATTCDGQVQKGLSNPEGDDKYCDSRLVPKTYMQKDMV